MAVSKNAVLIRLGVSYVAGASVVPMQDIATKENIPHDKKVGVLLVDFSFVMANSLVMAKLVSMGQSV